MGITRKKKAEFTPEYLDQWPSFYYQTFDEELRKRCLEEYLKEHPDSQVDQRRLDVWHQRYREGIRKQDNYFYAFTMLKAESQSARFLNRSNRETSIRSSLIALNILSVNQPDEAQLAEWKHFAREWMKSAFEGSAYANNLMGLMKVNEHDKAMRIANDIRTLMYTLPREVGLEKEASILRRDLEEAFCEHAEDAESILKATR